MKIWSLPSKKILNFKTAVKITIFIVAILVLSYSGYKCFNYLQTSNSIAKAEKLKTNEEIEKSISLLQSSYPLAVTKAQKSVIEIALKEAKILLEEKRIYEQGVKLANEDKWEEAILLWQNIPEKSIYATKYKSTKQVPHKKPKGDYVNLINYTEAKDPTYDKLTAFLKTDPTDENKYDLNSFVCTDFAEMLHNNSERAGIRAAYIGIRFKEGPGHAIVAFNTVDKGLVYVDSTGEGNSDIRDEFLSKGGSSCEWDKIAYLIEGKDYGIISINYTPINPNNYQFYEEYMELWSAVKAKYTKIEEDIKKYNQQKEDHTTNLLSYEKDKQRYEKMLAGYNEDLKKVEEDVSRKNQEKIKLLTEKGIAWESKKKSYEDKIKNYNNKVEKYNNEGVGSVEELLEEEKQLAKEKDTLSQELDNLRGEEEKANKEFKEEVEKETQKFDKRKKELDDYRSNLDATMGKLKTELKTLNDLENSFNNELRVLKDRETNLGTCYWKSLGTVIKIETY